MTPEQARDLKRELGEVSKQSQALVAGMDAQTLMKRPASGGWSVAENLQHLIQTGDAMIPLAEEAVIQLERDGKKSIARSGLGVTGWLLVKSLEPPARMKIKTTKPFEPVPVPDPMNLVDGLQTTNGKLATLIVRATDLATSTVKVTSPFNARARYNVYAAFRIMLSHTRRHLWQAERAKAGR
ncbi:MAG: DinB family protein [Vicinamibacteria bacterium]